MAGRSRRRGRGEGGMVVSEWRGEGGIVVGEWRWRGRGMCGWVEGAGGMVVAGGRGFGRGDGKVVVDVCD